MTMKKLFLSFCLFAGLLAAGALIAYLIMKDPPVESTQSDSVLLLEKIEKVSKLITVEGSFSESYDEKNIREITLYLPFATKFKSAKSAELQVIGKVMVGYDMSQIAVEVDSTAKTITLSNLPAASILAIDHSIRYKNFDEGWFNSWSPDDYTALNANAKNVIRDKVEEAGLLEEAEAQANQMLDVIDFVCQSMGWRLVVEPPQVEELLN